MGETTQQVLLLRHGETEWSRSGQHTGRTDIPLTEVGRLQATLAARGLLGWSFAAVLASPLQRARATAELAGLAVTGVRGDLQEWDYGEYDGLTTPQIQERRPTWVLWDDGCPGGEDAGAVAARVDRVIDEVRGVDGDVALVAHGHILRVLAARWCGLDPRAGRHLRLDTATVSVLGYERAEPVLRRWNDGAHLLAVSP